MAMSPPSRQSNQSSPQSPAQPPQVKIDPLAQMTSAEHLAAAKRALSEAKYDPDPFKRTWGRVDDAEKHLNYIRSDHPEYAEAVELKKEVEYRTKMIKLAFTAALRKLYAHEYEEQMLKQGFDTHMSVEGRWNTTLRISWI